MRRVTLMLTAVAMMVSLFAIAAYAADIQGTSKQDTLTESERNDTISGGDRGDTINASLYGTDRDELKGNGGRDTLNADDTDSADTVHGGNGWDTCVVDPGDHVDCEVETIQ
jgi:hypothetical protein